MHVSSEGPAKITEALIENAWKRRAPDLRLIMRDAECRGLALVVNSTSMRWAYSYRPRGTDPTTGKRWPNEHVTIGSPATHSVRDARHEANRLKGTVAAGGDPAAVKKAKADADNEKRASTLGRLADLYAKRLPGRPKMRGTGTPSPRHVTSELSHVRAAITAMQADTTPAVDLTERKIRRLLDSLAPMPATARARFGALSRFLDWCKDHGDLKVNPCDALSRQSRPRSVAARQDYLELADMARLWKAAEALAPVHRGLVRFLMAVPCRRGEATRLDWADIDLARGIWTQPGTMTKNGDPHRFQLPTLVVDLLRVFHEVAGKPVAGLVSRRHSRAKLWTRSPTSRKHWMARLASPVGAGTISAEASPPPWPRPVSPSRWPTPC